MEWDGAAALTAGSLWQGKRDGQAGPTGSGGLNQTAACPLFGQSQPSAWSSLKSP